MRFEYAYLEQKNAKDSTPLFTNSRMLIFPIKYEGVVYLCG